MKSYLYVKLSALLLIMFSNIYSIYSINLKKNEITEKEKLSSERQIDKDLKLFIISEKLISIKNTTQDRNHQNKSDEFPNINNIKGSSNGLYTIIDSHSEPLQESYLNNNNTNNLLPYKIRFKKIANETSDTTFPANYNDTNIYMKGIKPKSKIVIKDSTDDFKKFDFDGINYNNDGNLKKVVIGISIYFQLFLVFSIVSLLKLYEEYFKIKTIHCENIYSYFKDLTAQNKEALLANTQTYIFTSGKPEIKVEAQDEIFSFPKEKKFVKIERIVEIYRADEKSWKILGKKALKGNSILIPEELEKAPDMIEEMHEDEKEDKFKLDINTLEQIYTFPKIFSKTFIGKVI